MNDIHALGLDLGTMFIQSARDDGNGNVVYNTVRDCYRQIDFDQEFEDTLKSQDARYVKDDKYIYVLGNDAYLQAGMAEFGADMGHLEANEILKRPMKDGILNTDSPKMSITILRELIKACIEKDIGPARHGEVLYFSIPANPIDSDINNSFHTKMAEQFLRGLGYDPHALGEALALVYSENPQMYTPDGPIPFTGITISLGAGQANFCLAERGLPLDEFSIAKCGDWVDHNVARMVGQPKTKVLRVKEKELDFDHIDETNPILLGLRCYYEELIEYIFSKFAKRFENNRGSIDHPIDLIISGGTANPPGIINLVNGVIDRMNLPFEIKEVKKAKDMFRSVATGCYIRARQLAKKQAAAKKIISEIENPEEVEKKSDKPKKGTNEK